MDARKDAEIRGKATANIIQLMLKAEKRKQEQAGYVRLEDATEPTPVMAGDSKQEVKHQNQNTPVLVQANTSATKKIEIEPGDAKHTSQKPSHKIIKYLKISRLQFETFADNLKSKIHKLKILTDRYTQTAFPKRENSALILETDAVQDKMEEKAKPYRLIIATLTNPDRHKPGLLEQLRIFHTKILDQRITSDSIKLIDEDRAILLRLNVITGISALDNVRKETATGCLDKFFHPAGDAIAILEEIRDTFNTDLLELDLSANEVENTTVKTNGWGCST